ncbi:MAG: ArsR family transcriptional regulator [Bacteroidales bacterium]|nr:ArsR family transcriptional regulator [Candidatus Colimorpha merdihippi]
MKRIVVEYGVVKRLVEEGLGSKPTVIAALRCRSNTCKAQRIRQRALQLGGVVMEAERVRMGVEPAMVEE